MRSSGAEETGSACLIGCPRYGCLSYVQMGAASEPKQDAARFGGAMIELSVSCEYLQSLIFDQDEAIILWASQDEGSEHPGHPSSGETF